MIALQEVCNLCKQIERAHEDNRVIFLWIPGHAGISANSMAHAVAKAHLGCEWITEHVDKATWIEGRVYIYEKEVRKDGRT